MHKLVMVGTLSLALSLATMMAVLANTASSFPNESLRQGGGECQGANLLLNPSFEGQYSAYIPPNGHPDCPAGICNTAQMAPNWTPWWLSHDPDDPPYIIRMPEYKPADPIFTDPVRVRTGEAAQQYFTFFSNHKAGFYQQAAVAPGALLCFSIWGHSWSAQDDDDAYSGPEDGHLVQKIGIDPTGGTEWQSTNIIWGSEREQYDQYGLFEIQAVAQSPIVTVFVYSYPEFPVKHNDVYWDDAFLSVVELRVPASLAVIADVDLPGVFTQPMPIELTGFAGLSWAASLEPGGTLTPTLSAWSGPAGESPTVTIDSTGLVTGTYTATLMIVSEPVVPGSPATVAITLRVVPEVAYAYLPIVTKD